MDKTNLTRVQKQCFLGLTLYEKYRTDDCLVRYFVSGLLREEVTFSSYGESGRKIYFCGIPLWGRRIEDNILSWHIGRGTLVSRLHISDILERELNRLFGSQISTKKPRSVFVFWANSGEIAMLLSRFMSRLLKKRGLTPDDVVFLCTKPYHADMARLYFPEIKTMVAKPKILRHVTRDLKTKTWNVHIFFTGAYFCEFERQANRSNKPLDCIDWMANYLDLCPQTGKLPNEINRLLDYQVMNSNYILYLKVTTRKRLW